MSMYDVLKQLPIFQGISTEELTDIIEKVPFHFMHFDSGQTILSRGDECRHITFILSGKVRMETPTFGGRVRIVQEFESPHTMQFYNLFGAEIHLHDTLIAIDNVGVMQLDKHSFLRVLQQNKISLINVLNMLSTNAQKQHKAMDFSGETNPVLRLASWLLALTDRSAKNIVMEASTADWCSMLQLEESAYWRCVATLEGLKAIESEGGKLKLVDRYGLRTFVGQKTAQKE